MCFLGTEGVADVPQASTTLLLRQLDKKLSTNLL